MRSPRTPRRRPPGARLLGALLALALVALAGPACRTPVLHYPHSSPEGTAQAFADAFNRKERDQLGLLVHADRRAAFKEHAADLETQLRHYTIARWEMGERVVVDGKLEGRELVLFFADGATTRPNKAVIVESEGDWWLWKY